MQPDDPREVSVEMNAISAWVTGFSGRDRAWVGVVALLGLPHSRYTVSCTRLDDFPSNRRLPLLTAD